MAKKKKKQKPIEIDLTTIDRDWHYDEASDTIIVNEYAPTNPQVGWKWGKWTFGFWSDRLNYTKFGIDVGPLEICWRLPGYRP